VSRTFLAVACLLILATALPAQSNRWTQQRAREWYAHQPWLVGTNYIPATAINQLEMWQPETFDPQRIDLELGWAQAIGLNTMRVFLHDLPWKEDAPGFQKRIDTFLAIADKHHIRIIFVLFDSVWDPEPHSGPQRAPRPGVHNSGWVQSPGAAALQDPAQYARLEAYVKGVVGAFAKDPRVVAWDVWNEPSNTNEGSYDKQEIPQKKELVLKLLPQVFQWAREAGATQPLTSGLWEGDWSSAKKMDAISRVQLEESDTLSFHSYDPPKVFEKYVRQLRRYRRPVWCTEYMARPQQSTFPNILPIARKYHIAAINWGLVAGKTQTYYPWDSWKNPYTKEPEVWFHEIFRTDGQPYRQSEVDLMKRLTAASATTQSATAAH
jgi:Cellulase (glycosyl hydrolase family 5)